ncbi:MAG: hypothetical protein MI923_28680 [Phycisphaerales bacterium]|nr:hypothetical protein [Phycisphaerales bacterium]
MGGTVTEARPRRDASIDALRQSRRRNAHIPKVRAAADLEARREARLDQIQIGKSKLWQINLRLSQFANGVILSIAAPFIVWQEWAWWATGLAAFFTVAGMWTCARWMSARELRLCRHMACLARRRRACVQCGYLLRDLVNHQCPECGLAFDPNDTRHVLTRETVRLYSSRARMISTVVILCVLFWISALAQGEPWPVHVALGFASFMILHGLHMFWQHQAKLKEKRGYQENELPSLPRCPDCDAELCRNDGMVSKTCPVCSRRLTYGDVFVRPDVRRLSDRRITSLQYQSLILRWIFLVAVCGGLTVFVYLDDMFIGLTASFSRSRSTMLLLLGVPILTWVVAWTVLFRHLAAKLQRRLRMLFACIHPVCKGCGTDLSDKLAGSRCTICNSAP